jgi:hypothetical protein
MKTQNRFKTIVTVLVACIFTGLFAIPVAQAQDEEGSMILSATEFTIKPGHNTQFREGVKAWKACYLEHEGEWTWNLWSRVQGEGNVYVLASFMENWAEMDDDSDEAGQACQNLAVNLINPNIEKSTRNLFRTIPSMSRAPGGAMDVINVTYWRVKNGSLFRETVSEIVSTKSSAEGESRGWWYSGFGGNLNAPHFFVVTPFENFAAMDIEREAVWTVVENELGADKRAELQHNYRESVDQNWSYMFRRVADLSHSGTE